MVLGANDGVISVASLTVGIAASGAEAGSVLLSCIAASVAGGVSMAAGEYVSVCSQADTERADLALERRLLRDHPVAELEELTGIYRKRGLSDDLSRQVAHQLTLHDALAAHARDEIGLTDTLRARPLQAALASGASFMSGALVPILTLLLSSDEATAPALAITSLLALAALGAFSARIGKAPLGPAALRTSLWGALALALTTLVGRAFGVAA